MVEIDDRAFNNMQEATLGSPDRMFKRGKLFTESEYKERRGLEAKHVELSEESSYMEQWNIEDNTFA